MKVIVLSSKLKEGLNSVDKAVQEGERLPVLKNILIRAGKGGLTILATNLELGVTCFVSGKVVEEGVVSVPFQTLYKIISNSDSERINLDVEKYNLHVKTDNYSATIQGINPEEFPIIPKIRDESTHLDINSEVFKSVLSRVSQAAQVSEIRPEISGVLFDYQLTILKLAATDTFRLAEGVVPEKHYKSNFEQGFKVIVPIKTIQEVLRIFPNDEQISILVDDNQILFKTESVELISRLIDGEYPDYEAIIPKSIETELQVERAQFINALKLVSSFSGKVHEVRMKLLENKKTVEIYSASQDVGENRYLVPVKIKGDTFDSISFNWRYLLDGLRVLTGENIFFGVNGDARPSVLKSPEDQSYFYIVMPIKA